MPTPPATNAKPLLLLVDDEEGIRQLLREIGQREGFDVVSCASGNDALDVLGRRHVDLMLLDLQMPGINGLEVLRAVHGLHITTHIALVTGHGSIDTAVEAVKLGAEGYLTKPIDLARIRELLRAVRKQFEDRGTVLQSDAALAERLEFCGMVGRSAVMLDLFDMIRRLAPHARTVLVMGETGVGKELVAKALHALGPRKSKRFVAVNCSAVVETLFESELFGHVRGAFTGATEHKQGLFEAAHGGTIFLDEVGELPLAVQGKLLRVLETGEVQRVGSLDTKTVDVRVITATNRNLEDEVRKGTFRSDLYYRLNVMDLAIPPLRERTEDIPYLTAAFVRRYAAAFSKAITGLTPAAERLLTEAEWPGNVRQLRNALERACLLCEGHLITERDLASAISSRQSASAEEAAVPPPPPPAKEDVARALGETAGNKALAARRLGISRRALYRLLEKYGLEQT
jgi:DNA-binding NtrC family response regulator